MKSEYLKALEIGNQMVVGMKGEVSYHKSYDHKNIG